MNRRTFLKSIGLGLLACVVPNIPVEEEKPKAIVGGIDVARKEESKTIVAVTTPKRGWVKEYYSGDKVWKRVFESDLQGDIVDKDAFSKLRKQSIRTSHSYSKWTEYINKMHYEIVTNENEGMYYVLVHNRWCPNPDSENKFDGISHLIDKKT